MTRVATLRDCSVGVWCAICINGIGAVARNSMLNRALVQFLNTKVMHLLLLVRLAILTSQIGSDLSTNSYAVTNFDVLYCFADSDGSADNFVANTDWKRGFTPPTGDGVDIAAADTTGINCNVNVVILERLEFELFKR